MIRPVAFGIAVLALAGCGVRPTGVVYAGQAPVASASAGSVVFLLLGGVPTPVVRATSASNPQGVFDALLQGPTAAERTRGLHTELIGIQRIVVVRVEGQPALLETRPDTPLSPEAYAQIYCTGMALPERPIPALLYSSGVAKKLTQLHCGA